jgi:hypothetical protein
VCKQLQRELAVALFHEGSEGCAVERGARLSSRVCRPGKARGGRSRRTR